ncbi:PPPDE putative peptidase domain containing protein [Nitzschia inconspicua]|uniref:PPPDE putative peptidase domain containing protein n=1 Tax=Nitzschia inconspicua TaxID=303405 RepID=A0A9K3PMM0_9STRA|nr:PPPDE putative peptidase domain containing protein [Nitzschia inconspicua]
MVNSRGYYRKKKKGHQRFFDKDVDDHGESADRDSKLWSLSSSGFSTTSSVESLVLNPIYEVTAFAEEHIIIAPTGEVISHTGEVICHLTSDQFQTPLGDDTTIEDSGEDVGEEVELQEQSAIDIRPRYDREEVELIARPSDDDNENYFNLVNDSILLEDPGGTESQMFPMNLRVIRGENLPFNNCRFRVSVLNEVGVIDQVLGNTPWSNKEKDPIWGTDACSWALVGKPSTQLIFSLERDDDKANMAKKKNDDKEKGKKTGIFVKVDAVDLMVFHNPNQWIKLQDNGSNCGRIRVRLSRPKMATLHQQENCPNISPGPAFPRMESYAIRKKVMYCCSPVILNVYDVSKDHRIGAINDTVKRMGYGGIFHAAIQIHGREYSFGGTRNRRSKVTGIFCSRPKRCPIHHYRESVYLGDCELTPQQIHYILEDLRPKWLASSYNLFNKNCVTFSREFAIELGVGDIPEWVFSLASTAKFIEPYAVKLKSYLNRRTKTSVQPNRTSKLKISSSSSDECERFAIALDENGSMEVHRVGTTTQDCLLDHAMAARIQRSFRYAAVTSRNSKGN